MDWKRAFLAQAQSDFIIFIRLNRPEIEHCHQLHYLQMATEKLSKAILTDSSDPSSPPAFTHAVFVRMLQNLKGRPEFRRKLGFRDSAKFRGYINSLLSLAQEIEQLAPAIAGNSKPNPEYPWRDLATGEIVVPARHNFVEFNPKDFKMQKLTSLVRALLKIAL